MELKFGLLYLFSLCFRIMQQLESKTFFFLAIKKDQLVLEDIIVLTYQGLKM